MSRDIKNLHPILAEAYEKAVIIYKQVYPTAPIPFLTCTHRSNEEQTKLYALGRTVKGSKVTNAQAGQSPHNYLPSLAFDIAFITLAKKLDWNKKHFKNFADIIKKECNVITWGGNFKSLPDAPHFEFTNWKKYL
jgi:peptidoglycan LD-endopeptidase CwlK